VDEGERQPDRNAREFHGRAAVNRSEDDDQEAEGHDHLRYQRRREGVFPGRVLAGNRTEGICHRQHGETEREGTPVRPIPTSGKVAASTALPHPPNTSQSVPMNSAISLETIRGFLEVQEGDAARRIDASQECFLLTWAGC
jgi:hypothetical protein